MPEALGPTRIGSVTILTEDAPATATFAKRFGYREAMREGPFIRMESDTDVVDLRQSAGFVTGSPGAGVIDHVAFRAPDADAVQRMRLDLPDRTRVGQGKNESVRVELGGRRIIK